MGRKSFALKKTANVETCFDDSQESSGSQFLKLLQKDSLYSDMAVESLGMFLAYKTMKTENFAGSR